VHVPAVLLLSSLVDGLVRRASVDRITEWRGIAINRHDSIVIAGRSMQNPMIAAQSRERSQFGGLRVGKVLRGVTKWMMVSLCDQFTDIVT